MHQCLGESIAHLNRRILAVYLQIPKLQILLPDDMSGIPAAARHVSLDREAM